MSIKKIILNKEGDVFYVSDMNKDLHTQFGFLKKKDLKKKSGKITTNTGKEFFIFPASFVDKFKKLKRGAQIITQKDIGVIVAETGINKESKVVDAGGGSGALACFLGHFVKQVTTYEIREDFVKIIKKNIKNLELTNVKVKHSDVTGGINEKNVDLIVLDLPNPAGAIEHAAKALKSGAFLVIYLPSITQVSDIIKIIRKDGNFTVSKVLESIQREWKVENKIARPEFRMLGHTGFLSIFRRV